MKRTKPAATKVAVEKAPTRYVPDPHRRHRIVESKKIYTRKARPQVGPSDFSGYASSAGGASLRGCLHSLEIRPWTAASRFRSTRLPRDGARLHGLREQRSRAR